MIDLLLKVQKDYFDTQDLTKMSTLSLRKVAARLQFAPSTISRVISNKSVLLPWDTEVFLTHLMPGQRRVVLNILEKMLPEGQKNFTDMELSKKVEETYGVKVSRRTITACRHVLKTKQNKAA
jgi:DNA-directed RNA polymerase specialized sigma54-like protein